MYPKKIPVTCKKKQNGILYLSVNCHLDGKLYYARVEQEPLYTHFCLLLSKSAYYKGSDTFVALSELTRKRKHQSPRRNAKLGLLFDDNSDGGRLYSVKIQLYSGDDQEGQDNEQGSMNEDDTPEYQSIRLTGTTLSKSTTPKDDLIMEGDGSIVISWYGETNLLDDKDAFITEFGTATPPIYSTEPVK